MALRALRAYSAMAASVTPVEDTIRRKLSETLRPMTLEIWNDSHKHAHHKAMEGVSSKETHFRLVITSAEFAGKPQIQRHRMVNRILDEDIKREGGIHALQLRTLSPEEEAKLLAKAAEMEKAGAGAEK